eukprot:Clim_evm5s249 gene=Clim_evmTU5s249
MSQSGRSHLKREHDYSAMDGDGRSVPSYNGGYGSRSYTKSGGYDVSSSRRSTSHRDGPPRNSTSQVSTNGPVGILSRLLPGSSSQRHRTRSINTGSSHGTNTYDGNSGNYIGGDLRSQTPRASEAHWEQLLAEVKKMKTMQSTLVNSNLSNFGFDLKRKRVYFLEAEYGQNTLKFVDADDLRHRCGSSRRTVHLDTWADFHRVFHKQAVPSTEPPTREEVLIRERRRIASMGLTTYQFDDERKRLFFAVGRRFFFCNLGDSRRPSASRHEDLVPQEVVMTEDDFYNASRRGIDIAGQGGGNSADENDVNTADTAEAANRRIADESFKTSMAKRFNAGNTSNITRRSGGLQSTTNGQGSSNKNAIGQVSALSAHIPLLDPKLCPHNDQFVAFVRDGDLWVVRLTDSKLMRLTYVAMAEIDPVNGMKVPRFSAGLAEYVMQEEFHRFTGYWWRPKTSGRQRQNSSAAMDTDAAASNGDMDLHILALEVDEGPVSVVRIMESGINPHIDGIRYPRAGESNAVSNLLAISFNENLNGQEHVTRALYPPLTEQYPECEYVVRAGWTRCGNRVWVEMLNRTQTRMELVTFPLESFREILPNQEWSIKGGGSVGSSHRSGQPTITPQSSVPTMETLLLDAKEDDPISHLLIVESSNIWVNVLSTLHFLQEYDEGNPAYEFIWASEQSGFRHLYYVYEVFDKTPDGTMPRSDGIYSLPLTAGDWQVETDKVWVDEKRELIWFIGTYDSPLELHLYVISYAKHRRFCRTLAQQRGHGSPLEDDQPTHPMHPNESPPSPTRSPLRVTKPGFYNTCQLSADCNMALITSSNLNVAPFISLVFLDEIIHDILKELQHDNGYSNGTNNRSPSGDSPYYQRPSMQMDASNAVWTPPKVILRPSAVVNGYNPPELFRFHARDGCSLFGLLYRPQGQPPPLTHDMPGALPQHQHPMQTSGGDGYHHHHYHDVGNSSAAGVSGSNIRYPVVLYIYGGPTVQLVTREHKGLLYMRLHVMAMLGYAVVVIDGRGSARRGLHFEGAVKNCLGRTEMADQVDGLKYLFNEHQWLDPTRVAIHGWSYGGYLSLLGLAQYPDIFKVAISCAPVTVWQAYDTAYTERYLGLPEENEEAYRRSNALNHVADLPRSPGRILLIHGLIDENVHFSNTALFVDALIKAGKPYHLQVYPYERHGIRTPAAGEHYEGTVLQMLQQYL